MNPYGQGQITTQMGQPMMQNQARYLYSPQTMQAPYQGMQMNPATYGAQQMNYAQPMVAQQKMQGINIPAQQINAQQQIPLQQNYGMPIMGQQQLMQQNMMHSPMQV